MTVVVVVVESMVVVVVLKLVMVVTDVSVAVNNIVSVFFWGQLAGRSGDDLS